MVEKPIAISKNAFVFCRVGVAIIVWLGFFMRAPEFIYLSFFILSTSAILKIRRAPMIWLYTNTIDVFVKNSKKEIVSERAMRFAHTLGSALSGFCSWLLYIDWHYAWGLVLIFAILKTISASGFCPASKIYQCATNGKCCRFKMKV